MKRRQFLSVLVVAALPNVARAQQRGKVRRLALIHPSDPAPRLFPVLVDELRRLGYIEGENLSIERYSAEGRAERFSDLAREVVLSKPDIIFGQSARLLLALKAATVIDSCHWRYVRPRRLWYRIEPSKARRKHNRGRGRRWFRILGKARGNRALGRPERFEGCIPFSPSHMGGSYRSDVAGRSDASGYDTARPVT